MKLPKGILKSDLKYKAKELTASQQKRLEALGLDRYSMSFFSPRFEMLDIEACGWTIPTLLIAKAGRNSTYADRTYAITLKGTMCRVGKGPHVLNTIRVFVTRDSFDRLFPFLELYAKGLKAANQTRDRISTRRMRRYL